MPIYEYQCPQCEKVYEVVVSFTERHLQFCTCMTDDGEFQLCRRLLSVPGLVRVGGTEGKLRSAKQVRERNDAHAKSSAGQDEHRANVKAAHKRHGIG